MFVIDTIYSYNNQVHPYRPEWYVTDQGSGTIPFWILRFEMVKIDLKQN